VKSLTQKNLVFVTESLTHGGAERVLSSLVNESKNRNFSVSLILLTTHGFPDFYSISPGVEIYRLEEIHPILARLRRYFFIGFCVHIFLKILFLRKLLHRIEADNQKNLLVSFMTPPNIVARLASLGSAYRVLLCERVFPAFDSGALARLGRFLFYRFADAIVVQTSSARDWFGPSLKSTIEVIPNPLSDFPQHEKTSREYFFLGVGRLSRQKRFDLLIRAFARVAEQLPEWGLKIVGSGSEKSELEKLVVQLNLLNRIQFIEVQKDIWRMYDRCGAFVLSSDYEGFPNVLLEAMSRGSACIATNCLSGPSDLIESGRSGLLVPPGDVTKLSEAMLKLALHAELRERLGQQALRESTKHSMTNVMEQWISIFNKI
jgi:GalNAc-alpha-(1->4)-GalNAc-alpha-(1->3)-diNAcBac-PP-undecaprenol alpha-1,4-N-acetyl-D-galactosaminyltransferase